MSETTPNPAEAVDIAALQALTDTPAEEPAHVAFEATFIADDGSVPVDVVEPAVTEPTVIEPTVVVVEPVQAPTPTPSAIPAPVNKQPAKETLSDLGVKFDPALLADEVVVKPESMTEFTETAAFDHDSSLDRPQTVKEYSNAELPKNVGSVDSLNLPPNASDVISKRISSANTAQLTGTPGQVHWRGVLEDSLSYLPLGTAYQKALDDKESGWSSVVEYRGNHMLPRTSSNRFKPGQTEISGPTAVVAVLSHLGIGAPAQIPLWNSGFWVQFAPASTEARLALNLVLGSDKVRLGRESYTLTHSNRSVYTVERVLNIALEHVHATSVRVEEMPINQIRDYLQPQDIWSFIWGFLLATYPSGHRYETPCINDVAKCTHVFRGVVSLNHLQVTATNKLTDVQKNHMTATSSNSRTLASVLEYQRSITLANDERHILFPGTPNEIAITITTPSLNDYLAKGKYYINGIVDAVTEAMGEDVGTDARNEQMLKMANATALGQYYQFVKSIEIGEVSKPDGATKIITDADTIHQTLKGLSRADSVRDELIEKFMNYIAKSSLSIIAHRAYECPVCKKDQSDVPDPAYPQFKSYVPLDILQVFFGLHVQHITRAQ